MKVIVIVFMKTREKLPRRFKLLPAAAAPADEEILPYWTWFIENPRPAGQNTIAA